MNECAIYMYRHSKLFWCHILLSSCLRGKWNGSTVTVKQEKDRKIHRLSNHKRIVNSDAVLNARRKPVITVTLKQRRCYSHLFQDAKM